MFGGRVVETAFGAALGIAAVPGRGIDGEDEGPGLRPVLDEQPADAFLVDAAPGQRLVEAAVGSSELWFETQRRDRSDR